MRTLPVNAGDAVQSLGLENSMEEEWQHNPVFLPGKSHGQRSLAGYTLWGRKQSDMTQGLNNIKDIESTSSGDLI